VLARVTGLPTEHRNTEKTDRQEIARKKERVKTRTIEKTARMRHPKGDLGRVKVIA
jgi:hypothetical protein